MNNKNVIGIMVLLSWITLPFIIDLSAMFVIATLLVSFIIAIPTLQELLINYTKYKRLF